MMWRLPVGNFAQFARYETPMIAGFRKYALLYRKAATMQSRDSARAPAAAYWQLAVADSLTARPTPAEGRRRDRFLVKGFHLDMGLPPESASTDVRRITILREYAPTSRVEPGVRKRRKARPMTTTQMIRDNLLLKGLGRPVALNAIDWKIKQQNPSASAAQVQKETLETIRTLVDDGLFRLGDVNTFRFVASKRPLDRSIDKISHRYVGHYDDPKRWMFSAWMKLTDKGQQLALSLEERAIDSYREHEVTQDVSTRQMAEPKQLRGQLTEWLSEGDLLHRDVA
jgi:hypothetical protein